MFEERVKGKKDKRRGEVISKRSKGGGKTCSKNTLRSEQN